MVASAIILQPANTTVYELLQRGPKEGYNRGIVHLPFGEGEEKRIVLPCPVEVFFYGAGVNLLDVEAMEKRIKEDGRALLPPEYLLLISAQLRAEFLQKEMPIVVSTSRRIPKGVDGRDILCLVGHREFHDIPPVCILGM